MDEPQVRRVKVSRQGHVMATADVTVTAETASAVVELHSEPGHVAPGTRKLLVDEVLALPEVEQVAHLSASVPRGDSESLQRLQERCSDVTAHAAGATVFVHGTPPGADQD